MAKLFCKKGVGQNVCHFLSYFESQKLGEVRIKVYQQLHRIQTIKACFSAPMPIFFFCPEVSGLSLFVYNSFFLYQYKVATRTIAGYSPREKLLSN